MTKFLTKLWPIAPLILSLVITITLMVLFLWKKHDLFDNYTKLVNGSLSEAQKHAINLTTELNKFIVSLASLMFGVLGFYLANYRERIQVKWLAMAYFISMVMLGFTYLFSFLVYSQLTSDLAQNSLAMIPGDSSVLYYLEMAFWTAVGSSIILLFIFVFVFIEGDKPNSC